MSEIVAAGPSPATVLAVSGASRLWSRDLAEIVAGFLLIIGVIWTPDPWQRVLFAIASISIIGFTLTARRLGRTLGFGLTGLGQSLWTVAAALLLGGLLIATAVKLRTFHPLHGHLPLWAHITGYTLWAFEQQFILQSYFLARLLRVVPRRSTAILLAAMLFSIAHLPNVVLTAVTLLWGAIACVLFLRYRNLYSIAMAHGILGLCLAVTVPNATIHHMMVGLGYLRYHP